ncbi:MAG: hypothetical protein U0176_00325 [Bacteroidia bacterium]
MAQVPAISTVYGGCVGSQGNDHGLAIAYDAPGTIFYGGQFQGTADLNPGAGTALTVSSGSSDGFISRLDQTGAYQWSGKLGGNSSERVNSVATDAAGNLYVTGSFGGTADFNPAGGLSDNATSAGGLDIFVAKYSPAGVYQWVKRAGGSTNDEGIDIKVSADGTVYVVGYYNETSDFDPGSGTYNLPGTGLFQNVFVWKLRSDGSFAGAAAVAGPSNDIGNALAMRGSEVVVVGQFWGSVDFDPGAGTNTLTSAGNFDAFVLYLDTLDLSFNAAMRAGGSANDNYTAVSADALGHVWITGFFLGTADLDPTAGTDNHTSAGMTDILYTRLRADGSFGFTKTFGGTGEDEGRDILGHPNGKGYAVGKFSNTVDWDPGTGTLSNTSLGSTDMFVLALDSTGAYTGHNCFGSPYPDHGQALTMNSVARSPSQASPQRQHGFRRRLSPYCQQQWQRGRICPHRHPLCLHPT